MKKKNLKILSLNKKSISNLDIYKGGVNNTSASSTEVPCQHVPNTSNLPQPITTSPKTLETIKTLTKETKVFCPPI